MGWETRNGRSYYYRKERINGRVVSTYIGSGEVAELIAQLEHLRREEKELNQAEWQHKKQADRELRHKIDQLQNDIRAAVYEVLILHGYHQHKGQWRKMRRNKQIKPAHDQLTEEENKAIELAVKSKATKAQMKLAKKAISRLPDLALMGGAADNVRQRLIQKLSGGEDEIVNHIVKVQSEQLEFELGFDEANGLERLLIENVVTCWLRLQYVELQAAGVTSAESIKFWDSRLNGAQQRFTRACSILARVQKMNLPMLQINIAENQINQINAS